MTRLSGVRLLVLLQAVLLVPPLLLGSLCLRDGGAVFETGCACAFSEGTPSTSHAAAFEDPCGPCHDVTLAALPGSRTPASQPQLCLAPHHPVPHFTETAVPLDFGIPEAPLDLAEPSLPILRC